MIDNAKNNMSCPCCGSESEVVRSLQWRVRCASSLCGVSGLSAETESSAITLWIDVAETVRNEKTGWQLQLGLWVIGWINKLWIRLNNAICRTSGKESNHGCQ